MKKIKILHILHAVGGVDVHLRITLKNINSLQFETVVVHGNADSNIPFLDNEMHPVKEYTTSIYRRINLLKDIRAIFKVHSILKKESPDVIHGHSAKGGIIAKILGKWNSVPVLHTPHAYSYLSTQNSIKRSCFLALERLFSGWNNKVLAISIDERNRAIQEVGYKKEKVLLFKNAINPIHKIKPLTIPKTWPDNYICSVGRPSFQKNIELMVEVLQKLRDQSPNLHIVMMGVGYYAPNLEGLKMLISKHQLESNITLLEWTNREDIFNIIKDSQLYISTARYEGLPYSIIEALALSKACVVTDADGNRELVVNNHNGYVIFNNDAEEFKNRVLELLENDSLRKKFEENALVDFNKHYDITNTIKNLEKIYRHEACNKE